jgi:fibronectin type 3 domain-containing protein
VDAIITVRSVKNADLVGYKIYYGKDSKRYEKVKFIFAPDTTTIVHNLVKGNIYYFAATTIDTAKNESDYSNEREQLIHWDEISQPDSTAADIPYLYPIEIIIPVK